MRRPRVFARDVFQRGTHARRDPPGPAWRIPHRPGLPKDALRSEYSRRACQGKSP